MTQLLQYILDAISVGSTYAMLALGLTLVFSVMNLINFAYGLLLVAAGYTVFALGGTALPFWLIVILAVLVSTILSMVMGRIAFKPFIGAPPITLLITSFGVLLVGQYIAILIFGEQPRILQVPSYLTSVVTFGDLRIPAIQIIAIVAGVLVVSGFYALLYRTPFGMKLRASAEIPSTARLMGIKPDRVLLYAFAVSGAIAGIAGLIWFIKVGVVTPRSDLDPTLKAFIGLVLGGLGRISGAIMGGLALGIIEVSMVVLLPDSLLAFTPSIVFAFVILILVMRPEGLSSRKGVS